MQEFIWHDGSRKLNCVISSIIGLYFSYIYNVPSGAAIVLCTFAIYVVTLGITTLKINREEA